jgi:DNA polymerase elongation subunit (family B)
MTIFHILDAVAQDIKIESESPAHVEIRPVEDDYATDDDEYEQKKRPKKSAAYSSFKQLKMVIYLFGMTADGKALRASVDGFEPFFFVKVPDGKKAQTDFKSMLDDVLKRRFEALCGLVTVTFEKRKTLYGYTGDTEFTFAKLSVASLQAFRCLKKAFMNEVNTPIFTLYAGEPALEVFEANLDPMLRFFHMQDIKPCGWVEVDEEIVDNEIDCIWSQVTPCAPPAASAPFLMIAWDIECYSENGEFPVPQRYWDRTAKYLYQYADDADQACALLLSAMTNPESPPKDMDPLRKRDGSPFAKRDMDAFHEAVKKMKEELESLLVSKGGLSQSSKDGRIWAIRDLLRKELRGVIKLAGDPVIQIGCSLVRGGVPTEKHIFVVGTCDDVPGATVHAYDTEKQMIIGWAKAMKRWNPDVLMGYNVFGFDEKYLWERCVELGITGHEAFQSMSRLVDREKAVNLEEKMLSSSAMGDNRLFIWSCFGRLQVDLYHYIKRNFPLPFYKLDYVCQHFMSGKLSGVKTDFVDGCWEIKTKSTGDVVIGRYLVLLDETGDVVVDKLKIVDVTPGACVRVEAPTGDDLDDLIAATADAVKWAIVKDDVSPQDIFRLHRGSSADRAKVAAYCVQDCDLTVELYKKLDVFNNAMAMANTCSVPIGYIFTRGQGIKIESLIFKYCYKEKMCIKVLPVQPRKPVEVPDELKEDEKQESYEGAIVLTPKAGFYMDSPIGVADFASLYPSTIISENISYDTLVWTKDYTMDGSKYQVVEGSEEAEKAAGPDTQWTDIQFDIWGTKDGDMRKMPEKEKKGIRVCRYAQGKKGALPDIVEKLLAARKAKRKEAEKENDPFKKALLDAEQLAYKLTANSLYGQLGSGTFKIRLQHLAASVTAYGRKQIMFAKAAIEKFYGGVAVPEAVGGWKFEDTIHPLSAEEQLYVDKMNERALELHVLAQQKLGSSYFVKRTLGYTAWKKAGGPVTSVPDADPRCTAETVYGDTDSLFINFNVRDLATGARLEGKESIEATMHLTEAAGKMVTTCLKVPHDFEYDKTFAPFIIFSKKRYVGNKYEESADSYYQNSMGIATKRRDYAGIVKVIYGGAIRILLTQKNPHAAVEFVKEKLMELARGKTSMNQLLLTKSLRSEYKSATPPAHRMLADRITLRDPGNAPASGERISFIYVQPPAGQLASRLQGERIETPAFIKAHGLTPDARYYMEHQLMNPLSQLFGLIAEQLPGCKMSATATAGEKETAAGEFLFKEAFNECEKAATRRFGAKFGATVQRPQTRSMTATVTAPSVPAPSVPAEPVIKLSQYSIEAMFQKQRTTEEASKKRKATNEKKK